MTRLLERARLLIVLAVAGLLLLTLTALLWAGARLVLLVAALVAGGWSSDALLVDLLKVLDLFLVGTVLLIVALGLYELFVGDLDLPEWLTVGNLTELKRPVVDLLVVILAIKFLERAIEDTPVATLSYGVATALVIGALVAFTRLSGKPSRTSRPPD